MKFALHSSTYVDLQSIQSFITIYYFNNADVDMQQK